SVVLWSALAKVTRSGGSAANACAVCSARRANAATVEAAAAGSLIPFSRSPANPATQSPTIHRRVAGCGAYDRQSHVMRRDENAGLRYAGFGRGDETREESHDRATEPTGGVDDGNGFDGGGVDGRSRARAGARRAKRRAYRCCAAR